MAVENYVWLLPHTSAHLRVVLACSGFFFWSILITVLLQLGIKFMDFKSVIKHLLWVVGVSYLSAIFINMLRIISSFYITIHFAGSWGQSLKNMLHLFIGVIVFLPSLIFIYLFLERRLAHGKNKKSFADTIFKT